MTELKTLNDIFDIEDHEDQTTIKLLKAEAVKWVKADKSNYYSEKGKHETIKWIRHFFNLIEEDLEGGK